MIPSLNRLNHISPLNWQRSDDTGYEGDIEDFNIFRTASFENLNGIQIDTFAHLRADSRNHNTILEQHLRHQQEQTTLSLRIFSLENPDTTVFRAPASLETSRESSTRSYENSIRELSPDNTNSSSGTNSPPPQITVYINLESSGDLFHTPIELEYHFTKLEPSDNPRNTVK